MGEVRSCGGWRRFFSMHLLEKLPEAFFSGESFLRGVDDKLLLGSACVPENVPVKDKFAYLGMEENLCAEVLPGNIACGPPPAELPIRNGEFANEFGQSGVVGIGGSFTPQDSDAGSRDGGPIRK